MSLAGIGKSDSIFGQNLAKFAQLLPGLCVCALLAAFGHALRLVPGLDLFGPMILAIVLAILVRVLFGLPRFLVAGTAFAARPLLRAAVVLLGLQLTFTDLSVLGLAGFAVIAAALAATFALTLWLGRLFGVERGLAELIAAGTSVCGASAVAAANSATRAGEADVAYAIACVTLFGTLAMLAYPLVPALAGLDAAGYGLFVGASVHEVAQVAGAGFQHSAAAGEAAMVAKLSRVMLLAPVVFVLAALARRRTRRGAAGQGDCTVPVPWFVLGFLAMAGLASIIDIPEPVTGGAAALTTMLLTLALAAMGLQTDLGALKARGLRPLLLAATASLFIGLVSLLLVSVTG